MRNWFELPGFIFGPALVGVLGEYRTGIIGNVDGTVTLLTLFVVPAAYPVWRSLPEPSEKELEAIAVSRRDYRMAMKALLVLARP